MGLDELVREESWRLRRSSPCHVRARTFGERRQVDGFDTRDASQWRYQMDLFGQLGCLETEIIASVVCTARMI